MPHRIALFLVAALALPLFAQEGPRNLFEARRGVATALTKQVAAEDELPTPPAGILSLVEYDTPIGKMKAYLGRPPEGQKKAPAIIWLIGGFPVAGGGVECWLPQDPDDDQSAAQYREAGLVVMYPTLRGSFGNPGVQESFFGEVDDVLAALRFLKEQPGVDPERIYLGGHSTGGTLALLVAAATDEFKAIFAFGPVADPARYGQDSLTYDVNDEQECRLRAPIHYLGAITTPTWVVEGAGRGTGQSVLEMKAAARNPRIRFGLIEGADHWTMNCPTNRFLAGKLARLEADKEPKFEIADFDQAFADFAEARREAADLRMLARLRLDDRYWGKTVAVVHVLSGHDRDKATAAAAAAKDSGFERGRVEEGKDEDGVFYLVKLESRIKLDNLKAVFKASRAAVELARFQDLEYAYWHVAD